MRRPISRLFLPLLLFFTALLPGAYAFQSSSGTVSGTVTDPTGAVVPGAKVTLTNHVSGYTRTAISDSSGQFRFYNVPFNPYRVNVIAEGFGAATKSVDINAIVPV
ncbi:MAG TPA: carboxypeptidase-like regulatory domain-containing protein, partial [Edaphobacter sp.]|nr:carboxypeptidase-like regulatory domain-containing protein [Edaphobacter sp.]